MERYYKIGKKVRLGPGAESSSTLLGRTIRWDSRGFSLEPNGKHVDRLVELLELKDSKGSDTPGSKAIGQNVPNAGDLLAYPQA